MNIRYEIYLFNPEKQLVKKLRGRASSLIKNYYLAFYAQLIGGSATLKATDGSDYGYSPNQSGRWCHGGSDRIRALFAIDAPEEDELWGILIGTSDVSPTPDDYNLGNQFSCWCSAMNISSVYEEEGSLSLDISRTFLNDNTDTHIKEFGLVGRLGKINTVTSYKYVLLLRDTISSLNFPLDYSLSVRIKFSF